MPQVLWIIGLVAVAMVGAVYMSSVSAPAQPMSALKAASGRLRWWDLIVYAATALSFLALAATGVGTFVLSSKPMTGWILMAHATFAPPFAICVAALAISWADRCRFVTGVSSPFGGGQKVLFWLILVAALAVILSAVIPMTPLFGTHGQELLYATHQYSSLILTVLAVVHAACFAMRK